MDSSIRLLVLFVIILNSYRVESWNLSENEESELEQQLKLLNKPSIKTITTSYGEVYDCVDFYKQPAFDHPLLKNFTFEKSKLLQIQRKSKKISKTSRGTGLDGEGCPLGTVPIKRITKEDLIREKIASKATSSFEGIDPIMNRRRPEGPAEVDKKHAIVRTRAGGDRYQGMASFMSIYNPQCVENQYSAARMKMINGPDSIEVGWRVDPTFVSGDSLTRFYIRTDVGQTHCFNLRCPGFVATNPRTPIDMVVTKTSRLGGPIISINFNIYRDASSGLILEVGPANEKVGFWPTNIFSVTGGLGEMASSLEWGGEVFSPEGTTKPPMGSSNQPVEDTNKCAFFADMRIYNREGAVVVPYNLEPFNDSQAYQVKDEGLTSSRANYLILYGGPGGST